MILLKKIIAIVCLFLVLSLNVSAFSTNLIKTTDDFVVFSDKPQEVSKIFNIEIKELEKDIAEHNIKFLAVSKDKSKQIQLTETETEFSESITNLSNLSNDSINALLPDITGIENISGEILYKNEQKYVKVNLKNNFGNEYILTQFFTIENQKIYTLSFYTNEGTDIDYIDKIFSTTTNINNNLDIFESTKMVKNIRIIIILITVILSGISIYL